MKPVFKLFGTPFRHSVRRCLLATGMAGLPIALVCGQSTGQAPATISPLPVSSSVAPNDLTRSTFRQLGINYPITLRGTDGSVGIPFSVRTDRIVTSGSLNLRYSYSPALLPNLSHIKVSVNDVVVDTIALPADKAGKRVSADINIDPRLITDYNRLNLQLIGHYTRDCEDPDNSTLWANVDGGSMLSLVSSIVPLANDLSSLPLPFFDRRDIRPLSLPFVFAGKPDIAEMKAGGIVASWFGAQAGYRGVRFPASVDGLPEQSNAVVFATPGTVPAGIDLPPINGPTVAEVTHPHDPNYKLLLVLGRNDQELLTAASALALDTPMHGAQSTIQNFRLAAPRKPYDAPNWIATNQPVRLGTLTPQDVLSVNGFHPDLVRINLQLPPDLFGGQSKGVPLDLKYRYTPPQATEKSMLGIDVNGSFIGSLPLYSLPAKQPLLSALLPKIGLDGTLLREKKLYLPLDRFSANSQLRFQFYFQRPQSKQCQITIDDQNVHGAIDPASTIDLSGLPHYLAMPDLAAFANAGFPFSRMADLSKTAIVLPENPGAADISNVLNLLGHISAATGYPALGINLAQPGQVNRYADQDLMLLGSSRNQPLYQTWASHMPIGSAAQRHYSLTDWLLHALPGNDDPDQTTDLPTSANVSLKPDNNDVVLMGFESPLQAGRSVVAIQAENPAQVSQLFSAWQTPALLKQIQGSAVLIRDNTVISVSGNQTYFVGHLPSFMYVRWLLARHPVWLSLAAVLYGLLMALLLRRALRRRAARRLGNTE